jgi:uncharacterized membrane protein
MMHGYGFGWGDMMSSTGSLFNGTGWMVIPMMGISLLVIVGLVAWFVWAQRNSFGFNGPQAGGSQFMGGHATGVEPYSSSPTEAVEQIARRRYANGEIDTAEYKAIMMTLEGK